MSVDNFVERVHAYSKWLLGLKDSADSSAPSLKQSQVQAVRLKRIEKAKDAVAP
jgi:hypothetical protein